MNRLILAAALAAGPILASSAPAFGATRNYDCSKAGNANKAVCKGAAAAAKPAPALKAAAQARPKPPKAAVRPAAAPAPAKPGLLQRMSNALRGSSSPAPAARTAPRKVAAAAPASAEDRNPAGAIAQCKDGTYSHARARSGACSRHGGVARWS